jgi:hypothetical protein
MQTFLESVSLEETTTTQRMATTTQRMEDSTVLKEDMEPTTVMEIMVDTIVTQITEQGAGEITVEQQGNSTMNESDFSEFNRVCSVCPQCPPRLEDPVLMGLTVAFIVLAVLTLAGKIHKMYKAMLKSCLKMLPV